MPKNCFIPGFNSRSSKDSIISFYTGGISEFSFASGIRKFTGNFISRCPVEFLEVEMPSVPLHFLVG